MTRRLSRHRIIASPLLVGLIAATRADDPVDPALRPALAICVKPALDDREAVRSEERIQLIRLIESKEATTTGTLLDPALAVALLDADIEYAAWPQRAA